MVPCKSKCHRGFIWIVTPRDFVDKLKLGSESEKGYILKESCTLSYFIYKKEKRSIKRLIKCHSFEDELKSGIPFKRVENMQFPTKPLHDFGT